MPEQSAPTPIERRALEGRHDIVAAACIPGERAAMEVAIKALFVGFPSVRMDVDQARLAVAAYSNQLLTYPLWAVHAGCRTCASRNTPFPPSAGELRAAVDEAMKPIRQERHDLSAILSANTYLPVGDEAKARMTARFEDLKAKLGWNRPMESGHRRPAEDVATPPPLYASPSATQRQAEDFLAEAAKRPVTLPAMSPALRKAAGVVDRGADVLEQCDRCIITSGGPICASDCPHALAPQMQAAE